MNSSFSEKKQLNTNNYFSYFNKNKIKFAIVSIISIIVIIFFKKIDCESLKYKNNKKNLQIINNENIYYIASNKKSKNLEIANEKINYTPLTSKSIDLNEQKIPLLELNKAKLEITKPEFMNYIAGPKEKHIKACINCNIHYNKENLQVEKFEICNIKKKLKKPIINYTKLNNLKITNEEINYTPLTTKSIDLNEQKIPLLELNKAKLEITKPEFMNYIVEPKEKHINSKLEITKPEFMNYIVESKEKHINSKLEITKPEFMNYIAGPKEKHIKACINCNIHYNKENLQIINNQNMNYIGSNTKLNNLKITNEKINYTPLTSKSIDLNEQKIPLLDLNKIKLEITKPEFVSYTKTPKEKHISLLALKIKPNGDSTESSQEKNGGTIIKRLMSPKYKTPKTRIFPANEKPITKREIFHKHKRSSEIFDGSDANTVVLSSINNYFISTLRSTQKQK